MPYPPCAVRHRYRIVRLVRKNLSCWGLTLQLFVKVIFWPISKIFSSVCLMQYDMICKSSYVNLGLLFSVFKNIFLRTKHTSKSETASAHNDLLSFCYPLLFGFWIILRESNLSIPFISPPLFQTWIKTKRTLESFCKK